MIVFYNPFSTTSHKHPRLRGFKRAALRSLGGWRYKTGLYSYPLELAAFHRLFQYQRPETAGF